MNRSSGILLPVSALPGPCGIGDLGTDARDFIDFLAAAGQRYWQILPLNPPDGAHSPYLSASTFAGSTDLLSPEPFLARGALTADEVRAEGCDEAIVPARVFTGNRPTTSIFGVALTPFAVGELIALYEHITFVEGTVWGLDSYDQWGVELGKQLAKQITPAISKDDDALAAQDPSTQSLIKFYRANREF